MKAKPTSTVIETAASAPAKPKVKRGPYKRRVPSNAQRIRTLLSEGKSADQIAMILGVKRQYVYVVKHAMGKAAKATKVAKAKPKKTQTVQQRAQEAHDQNVANHVAAVAALQGTVIPSISPALVPAPRLGFLARLRVLFTGA